VGNLSRIAQRNSEALSRKSGSRADTRQIATQVTWWHSCHPHETLGLLTSTNSVPTIELFWISVVLHHLPVSILDEIDLLNLVRIRCRSGCGSGTGLWSDRRFDIVRFRIWWWNLVISVNFFFNGLAHFFTQSMNLRELRSFFGILLPAHGHQI